MGFRSCFSSTRQSYVVIENDLPEDSLTNTKRVELSGTCLSSVAETMQREIIRDKSRRGRMEGGSSLTRAFLSEGGLCLLFSTVERIV
jgi:hypothetical protein